MDKTVAMHREGKEELAGAWKIEGQTGSVLCDKTFGSLVVCGETCPIVICMCTQYIIAPILLSTKLQPQKILSDHLEHLQL